MEADWILQKREKALQHDGLREVPKYEEGAERWCTSCMELDERGPDSYGDCADCGERFIWVVHE